MVKNKVLFECLRRPEAADRQDPGLHGGNPAPGRLQCTTE